jgi:acetylglutamate kinase
VTGIRVVKLGGRAQAAPDLARVLAAAWRAAPQRLVVVHGGGDQVSAWQERLGLRARFVDGRRVTTPQDLELVQMVLSGVVNKRLVAQLVGAGVPAVGISGEDAALLPAPTSSGAPLGRVGAPLAANAELVRDLLAAGYLPVVSPVGRDADAAADALNVNGDDAAAAIAAALGADELLLVADVPGVLDAGVAVAHVDVAGADALVARGIATGGMIAKLEAAKAALARGVARVRISDLAAIADATRGTTLVPSYATA